MSQSLSTREYSRRSFVAGSAAGMAALAAAPLAAQAGEEESASADAPTWDEEYDAIVIGYGGAGATAALWAAEGGAKVLLCDKAPKGHEGGNTRYCAQIICSGTNVEDLLQYLKNLTWKFDMDEEVLRAYAEGMLQVTDTLALAGVDEPVLWEEGTDLYDRAQAHGIAPEYPEAGVGAEPMLITIKPSTFDSALWQALDAAVLARPDDITVWYESPAHHLVQDPQTGAVIGAEIEHEGATLRVHANNGVVLSCGGFENNRQMIQDYLGAPRMSPLGTTYNSGDGISMALEVGADLWHMNNYESLGILSGNTWEVEEGRQALLEWNAAAGSALSVNSDLYGSGSVFLAGDDGSRYLREDAHTRHAHTYYCGVYRIPAANYSPTLIFDSTQLAEMKEAGYITEEREARLLSAKTPEELAELIGADPTTLAQTVVDFNFFAENGVDYKCGRAAESMRPFDGDTYYGAKMCPVILNTQGGPRRNAQAQVVTPSGEPIEGLYAAGECGGVMAFHYQGGCNIAECLVFGRIAGTAVAGA